MFRGEAVSIGRISGIQIKIHATWLPIALLVVWSLAASYFPDSAPGYSSAAYWTAGILVALLFFVSLLLHELAHSLVARARGLHVVGITLYLFGGVSEIGEEAKTPGDEFRITVVGPLSSFALAALFGVLRVVEGSRSDLVASALGYLAIINLMLGVFNLLPGLPLDGGRILQAIVWRRSGNLAHATHVAVTSGKIVGSLMMAAGILAIFAGLWANGLWLVFLGWYLQSMATQEERTAQVHSLLFGLRVADLTDPHPYAVTLETPLAQAVDEIILAHQVRAVPVVAGGELRGLLTLHSISKVPRDHWSGTTVAEVMIPADRIVSADANDSVEEAIVKMQEHDVNQLPVLQNGRFAGLLNRGTIIRQLEIRKELAGPG